MITMLTKCPICNFPILTDVVHYYNGVPYLDKGCPYCNWIPPVKIHIAPATTGTNIVTENYQSTNSYIVYDDKMEK